MAIPLVLLLIALSPMKVWASTDAVVTIYTITPSNRSSQGTGFIVGGKGTVVTAYHVLQNATHVDVVDSEGKQHNDITLVALDPQHDIAVLEVKGLSGKNGLQLSEKVPAVSSEVRVMGSPRGLPKQIIAGRPTAVEGTVNSTQIKGLNAKPIFAESIKVIPLDITVYGGMSGAPVVNQDGHAIGILSGSYDEGRGIAWGIPSVYVLKLVNGSNRNQTIDVVKFWPPLTLMASSWISLQRSYSGSFTAEHMQKLETLRGFYDRVSSASWKSEILNRQREMYDDVTMGRCVASVNMKNTFRLVSFDAGDAKIRGVFEQEGDTFASYDPPKYSTSSNEVFEKDCYKRSTGDSYSDTMTFTKSGEVVIVVDDDDLEGLETILNTTECEMNSSECAASVFGSKKVDTPEFVNDSTFKWMNTVFRKSISVTVR